MVRLQGAWSGRGRVEKTHQALDEERLGQLHTSELMPPGLSCSLMPGLRICDDDYWLGFHRGAHKQEQQGCRSRHATCARANHGPGDRWRFPLPDLVAKLKQCHSSGTMRAPVKVTDTWELFSNCEATRLLHLPSKLEAMHGCVHRLSCKMPGYIARI